jgi:Uma2 family endonuclease
MAILEHEVRSSSDAGLSGSRRCLFTRDDYYAMGKVGVFTDKRVELIEGEIIEMAPIGPPHAAITHPLAVLLETAFGPEFTLRTQVPITLGDATNPSEPEPDIVVATGSWRDYLTRHPNQNDIQLIVEISDSTLAYDRTIKARLYSDAQIPEYWIVNLVDSQIEVHRQPADAGYVEVMVRRAGDSIKASLATGRSFTVDEILP